MNVENVLDTSIIQQAILCVLLALKTSVKDVNGTSIKNDMNALNVLMEQSLIWRFQIVEEAVEQSTSIQLQERLEMNTLTLTLAFCLVLSISWSIHSTNADSATLIIVNLVVLTAWHLPLSVMNAIQDTSKLMLRLVQISVHQVMVETQRQELVTNVLQTNTLTQFQTHVSTVLTNFLTALNVLLS